ncbi:DUF5995 family protein [Nitratireductor alexandrii]|uniref:DUF5995 family protein n=1 Tax=Nitratireductor alexandrii TaxID=2448161 RepID=UPI000FDABE00|nr:DUF5995 family protein [Nitratireductor alexandrii]
MSGGNAARPRPSEDRDRQAEASLVGQLRARALAVVEAIEADRKTFAGMPDLPARRIHTLFAGLYLRTTQRWMRFLGTRRDPEFAYLTIIRFYEIYRAAMHTPLQEPVAGPWRRYHGLAGGLTMAAPISSHLLLVSRGVRAHTRYDLGVAIARATHDYARLYGRAPDIERYKETIVGLQTGAAFQHAGLDYIDDHRRQQTGWRRFVLAVFHAGLRGLSWLWMPIFQHWRRAAWADARRAVEPPAPPNGDMAGYWTFKRFGSG